MAQFHILPTTRLDFLLFTASLAWCVKLGSISTGSAHACDTPAWSIASSRPRTPPFPHLLESRDHQAALCQASQFTAKSYLLCSKGGPTNNTRCFSLPIFQTEILMYLSLSLIASQRSRLSWRIHAGPLILRRIMSQCFQGCYGGETVDRPLACHWAAALPGSQ